MVKFRLQIVIFCIPIIILILLACSNDSNETHDNNSEQVENVTASDQRNLFIIESDSINGSWQTIEESNSKQRTAVINPFFISVDTSGVGQDFIFNVYEEERLAGKVSRVSTDLYGVKSISGLLHEDKGSFVFTVNKDQLLGQLRLTDRDKIIQIRFSEQRNEYLLTELNRSDLDALPGSEPMRH